MLLKLKQVDNTLKSYWPLLLLLLAVVILRIPNFFEPYWYGDEGIYLALGTAMRHGLRLYAEIIDHKTPLIYYLAMVPSQFHFRVLLLGWMLVTTAAFYDVTQRLFNNRIATITASVLFVLFTTLPWLEGNIPNGELFVMGFVIVGGALFARTSLWQVLFKNKKKSKIAIPNEVFTLLAGVFMGLGVLTKVPAVFDVAAFFTVIWFFLLRYVKLIPRKFKDFLVTLSYSVYQGLLLAVGVALPIFVSIVYFIVRGSGQAYLDFGLLYNFRYAGSWQLPFEHPFLLFWFSLPGKVLVAAIFILLLSLLTKWIKPRFQFIASWSILAMVAALLSNRPYPHYFLQVVPPLALTLGAMVATALELKNKYTLAALKQFVLEVLFTLFLTLNLVGTLLLLNFGLYPTVSYYTRWFKLVTGQISTQEYNQTFDRLMSDNYEAAEIITSSPDPYLFIWGTNPMLYALTEKVPTGRFTVSFHIKDFDAYEETLTDLKARKPEYIVVMKNETSEFPGFYEYLTDNYIPNNNFSNFTLWKLL